MAAHSWDYNHNISTNKSFLIMQIIYYFFSVWVFGTDYSSFSVISWIHLCVCLLTIPQSGSRNGPLGASSEHEPLRFYWLSTCYHCASGVPYSSSCSWKQCSQGHRSAHSHSTAPRLQFEPVTEENCGLFSSVNEAALIKTLFNQTFISNQTTAKEMMYRCIHWRRPHWVSLG